MKFVNGPYEKQDLRKTINGITYQIYRHKTDEDTLTYTEKGGFWRVGL